MNISSELQTESWMTLAQPIHGSTANPRYLQLLAALDEGWQITSPVYRRPRWIDDHACVYHFILNHPERTGTHLITVPEDDTVREFLRLRRLSLM